LAASLLEGLLFARFRLAWVGFEWVPTACMAAVLYCGIAAVLVFQYSRRRTAVARILAGAGGPGGVLCAAGKDVRSPVSGRCPNLARCSARTSGPLPTQRLE